MIGNITGINGVTDNTTALVFAEGTRMGETPAEATARRFTGGEVDSPTRNLARYIQRMAGHVPNLDVMVVYRLDRFGRGGHHRPFNDLGYPAVRVMETNEHYDRQHQDLRTEQGRVYATPSTASTSRMRPSSALTPSAWPAWPGRPRRRRCRDRGAVGRTRRCHGPAPARRRRRAGGLPRALAPDHRAQWTRRCIGQRRHPYLRNVVIDTTSSASRSPRSTATRARVPRRGGSFGATESAAHARRRCRPANLTGQAGGHAISSSHACEASRSHHEDFHPEQVCTARCPAVTVSAFLALGACSVEKTKRAAAGSRSDQEGALPATTSNR